MENQDAVLELPEESETVGCAAQITFEDEVFHYLDNLKESGTTNMLGAAPYIEDEFLVSKSEAQALLMKWIRSFDN